MTQHTLLRRPLFTATALAAALLAGCGGGNDDSLSQDIAQGYAADATTMTVGSAGSLDSAAAVLETGVANAAAAGKQMQPQAEAQAVTGSATCVGGGTVSWTVTGTTPELLGNGQLDAGEDYSVTYAGCNTAESGAVLDGTLALHVTAIGSSNTDLTLTATALKSTTANGSVVVNGSSRRTRTVVIDTDGSRHVTAQLRNVDISLATTFGTRQASYELTSPSWTIVRDFSPAGALVGRSHDGSLTLVSHTPRRPNATLQVTTVGALTISPTDGLAAAGHFKVVTSNNTIDCVYGGGTVTLTLDLGNNGTIDRTWVLTRTVYNGEAG